MMDLNYEFEIPDGVLSLVTFCLTLVLTKFLYSGRNISEVLIFFSKNVGPHLER